MTQLQPKLLVSLLAASLFLAACGDDDDDNNFDIPTNGEELFDYLKADSYSGFVGQSAVNDATQNSPHNKARTFVNDTLEASLAAGNQVHPEGSAAIKEIYQSDGTTLDGWAVSVKTGPSNDGQGWYWYEILSTTSSANPIADGNGVSLCTGCHGTNGTDYVRIEFPFSN